MYNFNQPIDGQKPVTSKAVSFIFGGLLVTLSALTTAAFFYQYAGSAFSFLIGDLSPWLSALVGVLCFEIASLVWAWLRANDADTAQQLAVSNIAAWLTMAGGLAVTVVYFGLTVDLVSDNLDETAVIVLSLFGALLIVAGIAGNFAAGHIYRIGAASHAEASQQAELRAMQTGAAHAANREATYATLQQTLDEIRRQLPETSNKQGAANARQFVSEKFAVSANGANPTERPDGR
jgi:hypothetical protein